MTVLSSPDSLIGPPPPPPAAPAWRVALQSLFSVGSSDNGGELCCEVRLTLPLSQGGQALIDAAQQMDEQLRQRIASLIAGSHEHLAWRGPSARAEALQERLAGLQRRLDDTEAILSDSPALDAIEPLGRQQAALEAEHDAIEKVLVSARRRRDEAAIALHQKARHLAGSEIQQAVGVREAPIPWPVGKQGGHRFLIVYGDLAEAVRREAAATVALLWKVGSDTVWRWRKALGVGTATEGTRRLKSEYARGPAGETALRANQE
jgi:hypothetical protein